MDIDIPSLKDISSEPNKLYLKKSLLPVDIIKFIYITISYITTMYCLPISSLNLSDNYLAFSLFLLGIFCDYLESVIISYNKLHEITDKIDSILRGNLNNCSKDKKEELKKKLGLSNKRFISKKTLRNKLLYDNEVYNNELQPKIQKNTLTYILLTAGCLISLIFTIYYLELFIFNMAPGKLLKIANKGPLILFIIYILKIFNDSPLNNFIYERKVSTYFD
ncbi:MAG: hypothetical protein SOT71_04615 [Romboutsia timonensis]|uniref:hypothetical protein n=1 Tax=Romboutsia timonensis TaxID=1776391 RepID=UPI002A752477|nr:hypothetical protein [Romboutsia timonensis]MDY2881917.1 hypothetical protein [Romboutsia timonensis]